MIILEKKKVTKAQMRATAKFEKAAYFKTLIRFPAEKERDIREAANMSRSLNDFIVKAVLEKVDNINRQV